MVETRPDEEDGGSTPFTKVVASAPNVLVLLLALVMPAVCVVLASCWINQGENEDSVTSLWIRETSSLYRDTEYRTEVRAMQSTASTSVFFAVSKSRNVKDILQAELLKDVEARLSEAQRSTRVTVDGMEFTFEDVCSAPGQGQYFLPCIRFTLLDCFAEGGYDFPAAAATWWQEQVLAQSRDAFRDALIAQALADSTCAQNCTIDGSHPVLAPLSPELPVGTWPSAEGCSGCLVGARSNPALQETQIYYGALMALKPRVIAMNNTVLVLEASVANLGPADTAQWDDVVNTVLTALLGVAGKTPYTCENFAQRQTCNPPQGGPRPELQNAAGEYLSREEVRAAVRRTCYNWDEGQSMPPYNKYLYYGGVEPSIEAENYTSMRAMSSMYLLIDPASIKERVEESDARPGGRLNVTVSQAEKVLDRFKQAFEASISRGWDDAGQRIQHTAFSDDVGAGGTFRTAMREMIRDSARQQLLFFVAIPFISALLFFECFRNPLVESRMVLMFVGTIVVILGYFGALGITTIVGYKLNIAHYAILPFLLVGVGVDDTYIVAMSTSSVTGETAEERFVKAMKRVLSPVIMTSGVNIIQFMALWLLCDLGTIYQVALTGFCGCGLQCLNIIACFMPLVLLDLRRSSAGRCDVVPCIKRPGRAEEGGTRSGNCTLYGLFYKRLFGNVAGRAAVIVLSLALFVVACIRLDDLPVGLQLADFFRPNTQQAAYSENRAEFFPTWPVTLHWGELDYMSPHVQMTMAKQFEQVLTSRYIADGLDTTYVWTAAISEWSIPSVFNLQDGPCQPHNTLTGGDCGENHGCESTFVENTLGLKLREQPEDTGMCYRGELLIQSLPADHPRRSEFSNTTEYCPAAQWNSTHFRHCYSNWAGTPWGGIVNPRIAVDLDSVPRLPIRYSAASANNLFFSIRTHSNDDYVALLRETRRYVDDNDDIHSWLSGNAYYFWEQYVDIVEFTFRVGAWSVAFGTLVSFLFLLVEFSLQAGGVPCRRRVGAALFGAVLVAAMCFLSMVTVIGLCGWFEIKFSVFTAASCVLSAGFTVEYTVHIIHNFFGFGHETAIESVLNTMARLAWPTFISFLTSMLSACMLLVINIQFVTTYFFGPLMMSILTTFFFGSFLLPSLLGMCSCLPTLQARVERTEAEENDPKSAEKVTDPERRVVTI